ncbi:MAG: hypothetical protein A2057_17815 [Ignavibacteria bacterium GWA2_35_9]|nr:MAG: hypothetical protein A2057_17815 [Ignavibacteria bacterium GWA2_35_9]OGU48480.1 MAG: hypothetical protein A2000_09615 [Ignavibacteria bacterium GWB2_36_8]OGU49455.1 MAG: hypothetical protein A2080_14705 [Ignavibacteria bacterium GWC2_36_12]
MLRSNNSAMSFWGPILIAAVLIIPFYLLFIADNNSVEKTPVESEPGRAENYLDLTPLSPPVHETVKTNIDEEMTAPFEIKTDSGKYYLVKLADVGNNSKYFMIFVYGGQTIKVKVPLGNYIMKYCNGNNWYGYKELFGPEGSYNKSEDIFNFNISDGQINGITVTLYGVISGNLEIEAINREDF